MRNKEDWQRFVKDAYLWLDYISIPNIENSTTFPLVDGDETEDYLKSSLLVNLEHVAKFFS